MSLLSINIFRTKIEDWKDSINFLTVRINLSHPTGTPPISLGTQGERGGVTLSLPLSVLSNPSVLRPPPLYFAEQNTGEEFK